MSKPFMIVVDNSGDNNRFTYLYLEADNVYHRPYDPSTGEPEMVSIDTGRDILELTFEDAVEVKQRGGAIE